MEMNAYFQDFCSTVAQYFHTPLDKFRSVFLFLMLNELQILWSNGSNSIIFLFLYDIKYTWGTVLILMYE